MRRTGATAGCMVAPMVRCIAPIAALAAAVLVPAGAAHAATLQADAACYVEKQPMQIAGTGFSAQDPITLTGPQIFASGAADDTGGFLTAVTAPLLGTISPATKRFTITAAGGTSGASASVDVQVATFTFDTSSGVKAPSTRRTWSFSGFLQKPGTAIYGHFRHGGRTYANYRFGVPKAPCGTLSLRAPGIPVRHPAAGKWTVQVDFEKSYDRHAAPRVTSSTSVFTTLR